MSQYFIFFNKANLEVNYKKNSDEAVACEIISTISDDPYKPNSLIVVNAESKEATFSALNTNPIYKLEIDENNKKLWQKEISQIAEKIENVEFVIGGAFNEIESCVHSLDYSFKRSAEFNMIQLKQDLNVDYTFNQFERNYVYEFRERVSELFNVESLINHYA